MRNVEYYMYMYFVKFTLGMQPISHSTIVLCATLCTCVRVPLIICLLYTCMPCFNIYNIYVFILCGVTLYDVNSNPLLYIQTRPDLKVCIISVVIFYFAQCLP